jgi:hypothetical protein
MLLKDNPQSFLSGDEPFIRTKLLEGSDSRVDMEVLFENHHEGFIGIPHGGLAMGLCVDAWRNSNTFTYPVHMRFRFGGTGVRIGDAATFTVEKGADHEEPRIRARITKNGADTSYLRAEIGPGSVPDGSLSVPCPPDGDWRPLPYYRNCFVCGRHRTLPGLGRRFRFHEAEDDTAVTVEWGESPDDRDRAELFLMGKEELHPTVLMSIFDENTAWGGFLQTRSAGLSAKMTVTLLRPIHVDESLLFVGSPLGTRGNPRAPRFFLAQGSVFSMNDPGNPELVAYGKGDWIIMKEYTRQIRENMLPEGDWEWIFGAGVVSSGSSPGSQ